MAHRKKQIEHLFVETKLLQVSLCNTDILLTFTCKTTFHNLKDEENAYIESKNNVCGKILSQLKVSCCLLRSEITAHDALKVCILDFCSNAGCCYFRNPMPNLLKKTVFYENSWR